MNDDDDPIIDADLPFRQRVAELRLQHSDLDAAIRALEERSQADQIQIARLKKRKLVLRDEIARIEDQILPDIIA